MRKKKERFRLYISENAPYSIRAIVNLKRLFEQLDLCQGQLEILDIHKHAHMAFSDKIQVVPTLLKLTTKGSVRWVGDISNKEMLRRKFSIE